MLFAINAIVKPFYLFGIDRTVQNEVGSSDYGIFATLFSFIFIFQIVADVGLQNFSQQWISRQRGSVQSTLSRTMGLKVMLSGLFLFFVLLGGVVSGYLLKYPLLFGVLTFNLLLNSWLLYLRTKVSGLGYYKTDSFLSSMDKFWMIIIMGILIWGIEGYNISIYDFAFAQMASYTFTILFVFIWIFRKVGNLKLIWKRTVHAAILKKSLPFALAVFLMTLFTRVDIIMIENILEDGFYQVGAYYGGMRLLDAVNIAGFLVAGLLLPMFSNASRSGSPPLELARNGWFVLISVALPIAAVCFIFGEEIARALYVEADEQWGKIISILMLTFIVRSSDYVFGSLLTAYKQLRTMNKVFIGALILNIMLNLYLLPQMKAVGAAYATLATQGSVAIIFIYLAHRKILKASIWKTVFPPLILSIGLVIIGWGSYWLPWHWLWKAALLFSSSILLSAALGMLSSVTDLIKLKGE